MKTTDTEKWHGWERETEYPERRCSLHIGSYPDRKQVALFECDADGDYRVLAYFRSEMDALYALDFLDNLIGIPRGSRLAVRGDEFWPSRVPVEVVPVA